MWLPYWLLLLLSFRSFPTQHVGLGILVDPDGPVADMCCSAHAVLKHEFKEALGLGKKKS